jgi:hypothetical protein
MAFDHIRVQSYSEADCDSDIYLVVAKVWEKLAVGKQAEQKFDVERVNFKKLRELVRKQYQIKNSNRLVDLENLNYSDDINRTWKESTIVPTYKKGDKRDCSNYKGISVLSTTYKILSNILQSRVTPYAVEIIEDHQCGFQRNRSITDHILCIIYILEKKWEQSEAMQQPFIVFKKVYHSVRREDVYNTLIQFCIPMKLARLKNVSECNYSRERVGIHLSDMSPIKKMFYRH